MYPTARDVGQRKTGRPVEIGFGGDRAARSRSAEMWRDLTPITSDAWVEHDVLPGQQRGAVTRRYGCEAA